MLLAFASFIGQLRKLTSSDVDRFASWMDSWTGSREPRTLDRGYHKLKDKNINESEKTYIMRHAVCILHEKKWKCTLLVDMPKNRPGLRAGITLQTNIILNEWSVPSAICHVWPAQLSSHEDWLRRMSMVDQLSGTAYLLDFGHLTSRLTFSKPSWRHFCLTAET